MSKWVHLTTAPDQITAEIWVDILRQEGIGAMVHPSDAISFLGISAVGCRIRAQEEDLERARAILGVDPDS